MPKVGKTHYPYTAKGRAMAKAAAKKKGVKVAYHGGGLEDKKLKKGMKGRKPDAALIIAMNKGGRVGKSKK